AELVAPPMVQSAEWSPDSRFVLARREYVRLTSLTGPPPAGELSLVVWNARTRRPVEVWKQPLGTYAIEQATWLHGADVAFVIARWNPPAVPGNPPAEPRRLLLRVDAARGAA